MCDAYDPINTNKGHRDLFWDVDYVYGCFYDGDFDTWITSIRNKNRKAVEPTENPDGSQLQQTDTR